MEKNLGKRKMQSILSNETGIPYKDIAVYGRYKQIGQVESLEIGTYTLKHANGKMHITEPDYSQDEPQYVTREVEAKRIHT